MKKCITIITFCFLAAFISSGLVFAKQPDFPKDGVVEKDIRGHWSAESQILNIQKDPKDSEWHTQVIVESGVKITRGYINYKIKVKKGGSVNTYSVSVSYYLNDGIWSFKALGIGGDVVSEAREGVTPPEKDEVKQMIKIAIEENKKFDFSGSVFVGTPVPLKVSKVLVSKPEFKDYGSKFTYIYLFDFDAVDANGKKLNVTDMKFYMSKKSASDREWETKIDISGLEKINR